MKKLPNLVNYFHLLRGPNGIVFDWNERQILKLLTEDSSILNTFAKAFRQMFVKDTVKAVALLEFSNYCCCSCKYCGLSTYNNKVLRYRLTKQEILSAAQNAKDAGFKWLVMQSGEDVSFSQNVLCDIIRSVKKLGMDIILSCGEKSYQEYDAYYKAGARGYLLRIETSDKDLYNQINPQKSWKRRDQCLRELKKIGYKIVSGIMVGLPGQDDKSIADDLVYLRKIGADMIGIGPFIPHKETPFANEKGGTLDLALRTMAVARLLFPQSGIIATTALDAIDEAKNGCKFALETMADVVMCKVTPKSVVDRFDLFGAGKNGNCSNSVIDWLRQQKRTLSFKI